MGKVVYKITNNINGKEYVGRTTQGIHDRVRGYKKEIHVAKKGIRNARPIVKAMIDYGIDNFTFEVLATADTVEELDELEQFYIDKLGTLIPQGGYNDMRGNIDRRMSESTKNKLSEIAMSRDDWSHMPRGKDHTMSTEVIELTTGKVFESTLDADRYFDIDGSRDVTSGQVGSLHGKVFRKIIDGVIVVDNTLPVKSGVYDNILDKYKKYATKGANQEEFEIVDITTGKVYRSIRDASRELGISAGNISRNINGHIGTAGGRVFRKIEDGVIYYNESFARPRASTIKKVQDKYKEVV